MMPRAMFPAAILMVLLTLPQLAEAVWTHAFDCKNCHVPTSAVTSISDGRICLGCHATDIPSYTMGDSYVSSTDWGFNGLDASNAMGYNPAVAGKTTGQISHNWLSAPDAQTAAGAEAPSKTTYPQFYTRNGASHKVVTCSRCHDIHGERTNPQLLILGANTAETMCTACHVRYNQLAGHTEISHPINVAYPSGDSNYKQSPPPPNLSGSSVPMGSGVALLNNTVVCGTCHQTHFADSDPATPDIPSNYAVLSGAGGDGKQLRTYGRVLGDAGKTSTLCQTCHVYQTHGGTHTTLGCLDCHGGHSPAGNYYMLRPQVTQLDWVPKDLAPGNSDTLAYVTPTASWMNAGGTGYCQGCHDIPVDESGNHNGVDAGNAADCRGCHDHQGNFKPTCNTCHGYAPEQNVASGPRGFAVDPVSGKSYQANGVNPKTEATTAHIDHADYGSLEAAGSNYKFQCSECHSDPGFSSELNTPGSLHRNGVFEDVVFNGRARVGGMSPGYNVAGNGTCANVYCHSNGGKRIDDATRSYVAASIPAWQGGRNAISSCTACHNVPGASASTAHAIHLTKGYACSVCHVATVTGSTTLVRLGGNHVDGHVDVSFDNAFSLGKAALGTGSYGNTDGSCTVYCHSNGRSATAQTPDWDVATTGDCGDCHGVAAGQGLLGSHDKHLAAGVTCNVCHPAGAATGSHASHLDGTVDYPAQAVCNVCHGATAGQTSGNDREPVWGNAATSGCAICHNGSAIAQVDPDGAGGPLATMTAPGKPSFFTLGHGDPNLTAGGIELQKCTPCHTLTGDHLGGAASDQLAGGGTLDDSFCHTCHATTKSHYGNGGTGLSSDGNSCANCHEVHGEGMGSNADAMLIIGTGFTDRAARSSYWNAGNTGVCQICHDPAEVSNFNRSGNADATHFAGQVCTDCHRHTDTPSFQANANACGDCHNALLATAPHAAHVNKLNAASIETDLSDCLVCHAGVDQYTLTGSANGLHRDDNIDVAAALAYNSTDKTCTNSCHSSSVADGSWNDTANWLNCTACHGNPPTNGGGNGTAHAAHLTAGANCATCHVSTPTDRTHIDATTGATDAAVLLNMAQEQADEATVVVAGTWVDADNTCSALYCHSNGQATPAYVLADWDTTVSSCVICHGGAGVTTTLTGSHLAHIGTDPTDANKQFGYTCDDCHVQTASSNSVISSVANHANTLRDVAVAVAHGGTGTIGGDFASGKCATTLCHGASTPAWATGATNGNCSACHGMAASTSDGRDTNGDTLNTDAQVGAHVAHLSSAKNWSSDIACAQCHKTTVTSINAAATYVAKVKAVGHIDSTTPAEVAFDTLAGATAAWNGATCATSYCHDGSKIGHGWSGTLNVPDWNTPFFNGTASHDCAFCHGYPPNPANGHPSDTDCSACHLNTTATDDGFIDVSKHLNNTVETEGGDNCLDCHGSGKYRDPLASDPNHGDHTDVAAVLTGKKLSTSDYGNASYWYAISYTGGNPVFGCGQCHPADVARHRDNTVDVKLTTTGEAGIPAINPKRNNTAAATFNGSNCSGVYCHGDGVNDGSYANSPAWDGTAGAAGMVCSACHAATPTTAKHVKHVANSAYVAAGCNDCHTAATASTHLGGNVTAAGKLTSYASANQTCTNSCHLANTAGDWTAGSVLACTDCHTAGSYIGSGANLPNSGLHATSNALAHDASFSYGASPTYTCTSCHSATPTSTHIQGGAVQTAAQTAYTFNSNVNSYDRAVGCAAKCHDDNQATAGDAGRWMRKWLTVVDARPSGADMPGAAVCDNCHGDGITAGTSTIDNAWNTGVIPAHNTDADNDASIEIVGQHGLCQTCHGWGHGNYLEAWGTTDVNQHGNGTLSMNGPDASPGPAIGAEYDDSTFGCAAACHSGANNTNHQLADSGWTLAYGDFGSGDCNTCHATELRTHSATTESVSTHDLHTGSALTSACTQCHPHDGTSVTAGTGVHSDGTVNFSAKFSGAGFYDYAGDDFGGNCSSNTCHDTDDGTNEWKNVSLGGDACADCHDSGKTGIFSGLSAYPPTSNKHGLHLANTALIGNCSECHGHNGTLSNVSPFTNHIDGSLAVGDQLTSYTAPTCANTCHDLAGSAGAVTWTGANALGCADCHNKAANTISTPVHAGLSPTVGPTTGKHGSHVGADADYMGAESCVTCHKHKGELGAAGIAAGHATGAISYDTAKTDYVSGTQTCTNVCHLGNTTGDWTAVGALACTDCHTQSTKTLGAAGTAGMSATVAPATGRHTVHINSNNYVPNNCTDCHGHSGALTKGSNGHVAGASKADIGMGGQTSSYDKTTTQTCVNSCHLVVDGRDWTAGAVTDGTALACADCHNAAGKSLHQGAWPPVSAAHTGHLNSNALPSAAQSDCYACHGNTTNNTGALTGAGHLNLTVGDLAISSGFNYEGTAVATGGAAGATRTCANILCHNGVTTPAWGSGAISCGKCHNTAGTGPLPSGGIGNRHDIHANNDAVYSDCANCHLNAAGYTAAGGHADHQNLSVNVAFPAATLPGASYSDASGGVVSSSGAGVNYGGDFTDNGTCASVECHYNNTTPAWNAAAAAYPARCVVCHNDGTAGTALKNSVPTATATVHDKHVTTADVDYVATDCAACHGTGADTAVHTGHGQLNGVDFTAGFTYSSANKNCTNACHLAGDVNDWTNAGALACNDCHNATGKTLYVSGALTAAVPPATGKHALHDASTLTQLAAGCTVCHPHAGALGNSATTKHVNGSAVTTIDVDGSNISDVDLGSAGSQTQTTAAWAATCTNVCHSAGVADDNWTGGALECADCHGGGFIGRNHLTNGAHTTHSSGYPASYATAAANNSTAGAYNYNCANCHDTTLTNHMNNAVTVSGVGYAGSGGTCNATYCHSDGAGTNKTTPNWAGGTFTGDRCAVCHGNSPTTGTHNWHAVGIHYKTLYDDDGVGLMPAGAAPASDAGAAHGNTATADTIGCQTCHNSTVTVEYNAGNTVCGSCHSDTNAPATGNELAVIADKSVHADGNKNVNFASLAGFKSKSQLRNDISTTNGVKDSWTRTNGYKATDGTSHDLGQNAPGWNAGAKTCSTVDCHNGITTPAWNLGSSGNCMACHTTLPQ